MHVLAIGVDAGWVRGHDVRTVASLGEAELAVRSGRVDVVLCAGEAAAVRRRLGTVPVAVQLPSASTAAVADAFEAGADEVLHPGMGERERIARLEALARRAPTGEAAVTVGPLTVDRDRGEATWHGRRLQLTARERDVLHALAAAHGATVRREAIYRAVWGYAMTRGDRSVDVNVKRLRDKLAEQVGPPLAIETEPGVGYRLELSQLRNSAVTEL
jgi:DNA-binding response OmpR family regulator